MNTLARTIILLSILALGLNSAAAAQSTEGAPCQGDNLQMLMGQRAEAAAVVALCKWMEVPAPTWETKSVEGKGIKIRFTDSRIDRIYLECDPYSQKPVWTGELPMGLKHSTQLKDLDLPTWKGRYNSEGNLSRSSYRRCEMTREIHGSQFTGYKGEVLCGSKGIRHVILDGSAEWIWYQFCQLIQEIVPASKFTAGSWIGALGADIASEGGEILAAWVGMPVAGTKRERAGLTLELAEHRWIDTLTFDPTYKGDFPFGLNAQLSLEHISAVLGAGTVSEENPAVLNWTLISPRYWPIHVDYDERDPDLTRLALRCNRQEANAFYAMVHARGNPSEALIADLVKIWDIARTDSKSLKGPRQVEQGLFGPIESWNTPILIGGVTCGTVKELGADSPLGSWLKIEYLLRTYPGEPDLAALQLDAFEKALEGRIQGTNKPKRVEAKDKKTIKLHWGAKEVELFEVKPELRIEARTNEAGSELFLTIDTPLQ